MSSKIKSLKALKNLCQNLRKRRKRIVFTNGCFDLLHAGHVQYLEEARKQGDVLIVALNSDASVRKIKGPSRPLVAQKDRLRVIAGLESVNYVCLFGEDTPINAIRSLKPDVLIKGADWKHRDIVGSEFVQSYGGKVATVKYMKGRSTSQLIRKIASSSFK